MKSLSVIVVVLALGWYGFTKYQGYSSFLSGDVAEATAAPTVAALTRHEARPSPAFSCDGRTQCPQMHSCEEATYFLRNCPGVAMDGDGDGVPCESQWCGGGH